MRGRSIRRRGVLAGLAGAALLPMPALAMPREVRFTLPWLAQGSFAFVYVAHAKEFLKKRGIDIAIARGFGSFAAAQSIAAGRFDCGLCAAPALILSAVKGLPVVALATTDYDATMGVGVLADSPIRTPLALAGKKIASVPTSGEFPFFPAFAKKAGLDTAGIETVQVDNKVLERLLIERQVDAITSFALSSGSAMLAKGVASRWMLYSAAGIRNHGQTVAVTAGTLAGDPAFCEAMVDGLLEGLAFTLTNPDETIDLFLREVPEIALNSSAREFARIGLVMWQHSVEHEEARTHGLGWSDPQAFAEMLDLAMRYVADPGSNRPPVDALFDNRFAGRRRLSAAEWAQVRARVAEFDKYLG